MNQYLRFYKSEKNPCDPDFPNHIVDVVQDGRGVIGVWRVVAKERKYLAPVRNAMMCLPNLNDD